jgi:hypothetical protein
MIAKLAAEGIRKQEILHTAESLFHDHRRRIKRGSHRPGFIAVTDSKALEYVPPRATSTWVDVET